MKKLLFAILLGLVGVMSLSAQTPSPYPYAITVPNDSATGTTQFTLTKINSSGNAVIMATSDLDGYVGVCISNCGKTGNAWIAFSGLVPLTMDATAVAGNYVIPSTGTAGDGADSGLAVMPPYGATGRVQIGCTGAACVAMVSVYPATIGSPIGFQFNAQTGTSYTVNRTDREKLVTQNNGSAIAVTLPQAGTAGFGANFFHATQNLGAGLVTYTPTTSTINGAATAIIPQNWFALVFSDNTNYRAPIMPTIGAFPACTAATCALNFNAATGAIGTNTSITAAAVPFSGISTGSNTTATMTLGSGGVLNLAAGGVVDLSSGTPTTAFKLPTSGGAAPTTAGVLAYDSTANQGVLGDGTTTCGVGKHQVNSQSGAGYTVVNGDCGKLVTVSNASAQNLTLPSTAPPKGWYIDAQNTGAGTWTVSRNGLNIDGGTTNPTLTTNQGIRVFSDGSNYFTQRGVGGAGGSGTTIQVGGAGTSATVNFSSTTPAIPSGTPPDAHPISFQKDASATNNIDAYDSLAIIQNPVMGRRGWACIASGQTGNRLACAVDGNNMIGHAGTDGATNPTATAPWLTTEATTAVAGNVAGLDIGDGNLAFAFGSNANPVNLYYAWKGSVSTTTSMRLWAGFSNNSVATQGGSATPGGSFAAFRMDSATDTTTIQAITCNAGSCTTTSTATTLDTAIHKYEIIEQDGTPNYIFRIDGTTVATMTATLPPSGTRCTPMATLTTTTTTAITLSTAALVGTTGQ